MCGRIVVKHTFWFDYLILNLRWILRVLSRFRGLSRLVLNVEVAIYGVAGFRRISWEEFSVPYGHLEVIILFFSFLKSSDRRWSSGCLHLSLLFEERVVSSSCSNDLFLELVRDLWKHSIFWRCLRMFFGG